VWNLGQLADGADLQRERSREVLGAVAAARIAGDAMPDDASLGGFLLGVTAGQYRDATQRYGSPAYTRAELASAPRRVRQAADRTLVAALGLDVADAAPGGECVALPPGRHEIDGDALAVVIDAADAPVRVRLGVAGRGAVLRPVEAGTRGLVRAPDLGHGTRWVLRLRVKGSARICDAPDGQP
jgi:hypothetical protein